MCRAESATDKIPPELPEVKQDPTKNGKKSRGFPRTGVDSIESIKIGIALGIMSFLTSAGFRSAGFLYIGIMDTFGVSRQDASWPLSLIGGVTNLAGVIAGPLAQRFPTRPVMMMGAVCASVGMISSYFANNIFQLTLSLGVLYGFGCGVIFTIINITLSQYFDKYRAVAYGIVYAGSTMASFIFPNLLLALNSIYSFKGVLLIFGGIILHVLALSLLVREPSWANSSNKNQKKATLRESFTIFREPIFYLCLVSNILFQYGFDAFMTTLVDFAVDRGATLQQAVNLLPWFSVADFIGRGIFPFAADRGLIKRPKLITICYICTGVFTIIMPSSSNYWQLVMCILLMGAFCGCCGVVFCCVVGDLIGVSRVPLAFGVLGSINGGFYFTKPFFFGHFRDVIKSYDGMFHITGALTFLTGLMWLFVLLRERFIKYGCRFRSANDSKDSESGYCNPTFTSDQQSTEDKAAGVEAPTSPQRKHKQYTNLSLVSETHL